MPILLIGLNHRTAPVDLREQISLSACGLRMALQEFSLVRRPAAIAGTDHSQITSAGQANGSQALEPIKESRLHEVVILSTCNRLEVYAVSGQVSQGWQAMEQTLCQLQGIAPELLAPHLYRLQDEAAAKHLMRVASGLDSMVLGEPQILGQVGEAFRAAQSAETTGPVLSHLFARAVHTGKRARTETAISRYTTSVSHMAVLLAQSHVADLTQASVLVVGAGEMAEVAIKALQGHGAHAIGCINRTYGRAQALAHHIQGRAYRWHNLVEALTWADVVLAATAAPHLVIHADEVAASLTKREGRPLVIVDIALPRDVEESVSHLPGVRCYDIDDLQAALDENLSQRQAAVPQVEQIVAEEVAGYWNWLQGRQVAPVIAELRRKAKTLAQAEVEQALNRLDRLEPQEREVVARLAHRLVNKLLHEPTVRLKAQAANGDGYTYVHALRDLFALDEHP